MVLYGSSRLHRSRMLHMYSTPMEPQKFNLPLLLQIFDFPTFGTGKTLIELQKSETLVTASFLKFRILIVGVLHRYVALLQFVYDSPYCCMPILIEKGNQHEWLPLKVTLMQLF